MNEIRRLFHIDQELVKFNFIANISHSYCKLKKWTIFFTFLLTLYLTASLMMNIITFGYRPNLIFIGNVIAYVYPSVISTVVELQFCTMLLILRERFRWLNARILEIRDMLREDKRESEVNLIKTITGRFGNEQLQMVSIILEKTKMIHQKLCASSKQINKAFSVQILLLVLNGFLNFIITLFAWALKGILKQDNLSYADVIYINNAFIIGISEVVVIVFVCAATAKEGLCTSFLPIMSPKNFHSLIAPLFFCTKLFGLCPFGFSKNGPGRSKISMLWTFALMMTTTSLSIFSIVQRKTRHFGLIIKVWDVVNVYIHLISMCATLICSCVFKNDIVNSIRNFDLVDRQLERINLQTSRDRSKLWIISTALILITYLVALVVFDVITHGLFSLKLLGDIVANSGPLFVSSLTELQFCCMVLLLRRRFACLNFRIVEAGEILKNPPETDTNAKKVSTMIRQVKIIHEHLFKISKQLNRAYSVQMLLLVLNSFLTIILTLFYWANQTMTSNKDKLPNAFKIYINGVLALVIFQIVVLTICCSFTSKEAKRTGSLIHDVMPSSEVLPNKRILQIQLSSFSLQLAQYNVEFNACGVFLINETLLYTIVAAAAAYLVIVIQFELANHMHDNNYLLT